MEPTFRARWYDGVHSRGTPGGVRLRDHLLEFSPDDGQRVEWEITRVVASHRVAGELHVEIADEGPAPSVKLVVEDLAFGRDLDLQLARFDPTPSRGIRALLGQLGWKSWVVITALVVVGSYVLYTSLLPQAHVLISKETERALGDALYEAVSREWTVVEDEEFDRLVDTMLAELVDPDAGFEVRVALVDEATPNAFAVPGGQIVLFTGLLSVCPSADALAGVLAHEIVHVEQRHGLKHLLRTLGVLYFASCFIGGGIEEFAAAETVAELSSGLMVLKHSRDHEREADDLAVAKLGRAGRSALGLAEFFEAVEKEMPEWTRSGAFGWVSTHPLSAERIARISAAARGMAKTRPWLGDEEWDALRDRLR